MPQLDGLRAYAVAAVMLHHLLNPSFLPASIAAVPWGAMGVRLFFVLSGFLITSLLIQARDRSDSSGSAKEELRRFYLRRALRIFPIYYLVLFGAVLVRPPDAAEQLPWLATYTYNFWVSHIGWWPPYFSHFWSLAVEEQFYLVWPWIVLYAPRKYLKSSAAAMLVLAIAYRGAATAAGMNDIAIYTVTFSCMDTLGMGALLALYSGGRVPGDPLYRSWSRLFLPFGLAALLLLHGMLLSGSKIPHIMLFDTALALVFSWLVVTAARGVSGPQRLLLDASPVAYLGKISYGLSLLSKIAETGRTVP